MPNFSQHPSPRRLKLLLQSEQGTGKTAQIAFLANAGFKVRVLDIDNKLEIIHAHLKPGADVNIDYQSLPAKDPTSWEKLVKYLTESWPDLGNIRTWDENTVLVIDTASFASEACLEYAKKKAGSGTKTSKFEQSIWQDMAEFFETLTAYVTSDIGKFHIIYNTHIMEQEQPNGIVMKLPAFKGRVLPKKMRSYFNCIWTIEVKSNGERVIKTASSHVMSLNNVAPGIIKPEEPADLGMILSKFLKG
jgi:hypothetical protein